MWQGRDPKYLPRKSPSNLGEFGRLVDVVIIGWTAFALVIFSFLNEQLGRAGSMSKPIRALTARCEINERLY